MEHPALTSPRHAPSLVLFLALWPDDATRAAIANTAAAWQWPAQARCYAPPEWHATLHYLGPVPAARLETLVQGLQVTFAPFCWTVDLADRWPRGLAVLGSSRLAAPLAALHRRLGRAVAALDLPVQHRPLRPHVTLARRAEGAQPPRAIEPIVWTVRDYVLVQSTGRPPSRYVIVQRYPATGTPAPCPPQRPGP